MGGAEMISLVIVANEKWGDFATPYINSVRLAGDPLEIILVSTDGSFTESEHYKLITMPKEKHYNYMQALNAGAKVSNGDWFIFSNDDVLCQKPFVKQIEALDRVGLYGAEIRHKTKQKFGAEVSYIYGWQMIMHKSIYMAVGGFDEYYLHAGFDDIDFSWRAQKKGVPLYEIKPYPFIHLADQPGNRHRRAQVDGFREMQARSKEHFLEKVRNDSY
jgi:hypothetical protein